MEEVYKEIELYGLKYKVSNYGKVVGARGEIKQRLDDDGYLSVTVGSKEKRTRARVHRIVAVLFVDGRTEEFNEVNHIDCNRANPRADNLEWISHKENVAYSVDRGRHIGKQMGAKNVKAILSEEDVIDIRMLFDSGAMTQKELSNAYDVSWSTIHNICFRLTWTHLI